jgi:GR25 family glycosyltransferase involved in LPS biosynthesis
MKFNEIPKFVVNLERRPDRLEKVKKELEYIGWDYEIFKAIDTNSYMGITRSILEIIKIAKERNYPRVMVIEDDIGFMPYAKDLLNKLEESCEGLEFGIINLSPTLNRFINRSDVNELLLDMTNLPPRPEHLRDIYACNTLIIDSSVYDEMFKISETAFPSGDFFYAIDDYIFQFIIQKYQSYCPILPIAPQGKDISNISGGEYNNFYLQTYNWNLYSPTKIPGEFMNQFQVQQMKDRGEHKDFYYVS